MKKDNKPIIKDNKSTIKNNKSTTKKDIEKLIKEVKNKKIKKIDNSKLKNINNILNLISDVNKTPKLKKIETESLKNSINEVDKLLKTPKKDLKKLIKADKEPIITQDKLEKMETSELKQLMKDKKLKLSYEGKPLTKNGMVSKLVGYFYNVYLKNKESMKKEVVSESYTDDPKYKIYNAYVKKNKPSIKDADDIHNIVCDLIDKKQRMSKKLLDSVIEDLGITGSGLNKKKRKIKGGMINDDSDETAPSESSGEYEPDEYDEELRGLEDTLTDEDIPSYDEAYDYTLHNTGNLLDMDNYNMILRNEHATDFIHNEGDQLPGVSDATIKAFKRIDRTDPKGLVEVFERYNHIPLSQYNKSYPYLHRLLNIKNMIISGDNGPTMIKELVENYKKLKGKQKPNIKSNPTKDLKKHKDRDDDDDNPSKRHAHDPYLNYGFIPFRS